MDLQEEFHSSLADQGFKKAVPPGEYISQYSFEGAPDFATKPLPPIPTKVQRKASKMKESDQSYIPRPENQHLPTSPDFAEDSIRPRLESNNNSSLATNQYPQSLPPPPKPPMSNSNRKILQLTGHDPRYDRTIPQHSELFESSSSASSSSGSVYSQPDRVAKEMTQPIPDKRSSTHSEPVPTIIGTTHLKSSSYNTMGQGIRAYYLTIKEQELQKSKDPRKNLGRTFSTEHLTIEDFLHETKPRTGSESEDDRNRIKNPNSQHLVPQPLAIRSKPKREYSGDKGSILASARDSMAWGIDALTSPTISKHPPIPEESSMQPVTPRVIRRKPDKEMLKSPLKLNSTSPQSETSNERLSRKFSRTMKRLSGSKAPPRPTVISNVARAPEGPDTPAPKSGISVRSPVEALQYGNEHFQEAYAKAKKSLRIKTAEEKRRESLKKKIVVVGMSDQSPGEVLILLVMDKC